MRFEPSELSYGDSSREAGYYAQRGLNTYYDASNVGDVAIENVAPQVATAIFSAAGSLAAQGVNIAVQGKQAKKEREHQLKFTKKQEKLAAEQTRLAEAQALAEGERTTAQTQTAMFVMGGVTIVGLAAVAAFFVLKREKKK